MDNELPQIVPEINDKKLSKKFNENGDNESEPKSELDEKPEFKYTLLSTFKEILIALVVIGIIIGLLYGYCGYWPPIAVVESNSMMHSDDSSIGTMDTGDIILIKKVSKDNQHEVKTYIDGKKSNYKSFNSYGNVIAFEKNGGSGTPIIHRAVVWIEYNSSGHNNEPTLSNYGSFDIPSKRLYDVTEFWINDYKPKKNNLSIDLNQILFNFHNNNRKPHSGFLTKGDNNPQIDQLSSIKDSSGRPIEPVEISWILGKAEGEIPWFGLIRLYLNGETSEPGKAPPALSVNMLFLAMTILIIFIIVLHILFLRIERKRRRAKELEEDRKLIPFQKQITHRLSPERGTEAGSAQIPELTNVSKGEMLTYLDDILEVDEIDPEFAAKPDTSLKTSSSEKTSKPKILDISHPTTPVSNVTSQQDILSSNQRVKAPMANKVYSPTADVTSPPLAIAKSRYRPALEQPIVTGTAPKAKRVDDDEMLDFLDECL